MMQIVLFLKLRTMLRHNNLKYRLLCAVYFSCTEAGSEYLLTMPGPSSNDNNIYPSSTTRSNNIWRCRGWQYPGLKQVVFSELLTQVPSSVSMLPWTRSCEAFSVFYWRTLYDLQEQIWRISTKTNASWSSWEMNACTV